MTLHELTYVRYLLRSIRNLHIEKEAMAVVLDTAQGSDGPGSADSWRQSVQRMRDDPVFRSALEANLAPKFERLEQALQDEALLKKLQDS